VEKVREAIEIKRLGTLVKTEKKTKAAVPRIEGFDRANLQGHPKHRKECTLILCEGLSAKTYAVTGIETGWKGRKGRDWFGVYALRGKLLNVRNATPDAISKNKELGDIIKILGLRIRGDYADDESFATLSYGRVLIITDADSDGVHIASLLLNFFHSLFPSLLHRDFLYLMMTPIAKVFFSKGSNRVRVCYSDNEYHKLMREAPPGVIGRVKYYKGLGTSSDEEIHDTFGQKVVRYIWDSEAAADLEKAFHKKNADLRKEWLTGYDPEAYMTPGDEYAVSAYVNQELVRYSIDNCRRSLPNIFDGLKLSQRKILYAAFKRRLFSDTKPMKVAQLAGYVAEHSNYHHGEQCLHDTIVRMAHDFVGSNNMPYFVQDGQFGSRSHHGNDAANARYIFTRLHAYARQLFPTSEDELLQYTPDDGERVEPDYYVPILPMILVNGCTAGIGTGWSCSVPCYNPKELCEKIKVWVRNNGSIAPEEINDLVPYYHGFRGRIERVSETRFMSYGAFEEMMTKAKGRWFRITEIPVSVSTDKYKEMLEEMVESKKLRRMLNYSRPNTVDFHVEVADGFVPDHDSLSLKSPISLTNMVLFSHDGRLQKYSDLHSIFHTYCVTRMGLYTMRKAQEKHDLLQKRKVLSNKLRFLVAIHRQEMSVANVPEAQIVESLVSGGYDRHEDSYAYLLDIPVRWFSEEKIRSLRTQIDEITAAITENERLSEGERWLRDLNELRLPERTS
jgi:DNA topoisomerase-2